MSNLAQQACEKCTKETQAMSQAQIDARLNDLPEWSLREDGKALVRRFAFKNFKQALAFVNALGELAEKEFHHPDIALGWGYAEVAYMTHSIDGLHINDFIMAARTDTLV
jgi:4a-hydroxytetrahydrobiopterin dehydratase